MNRLFVFCLVAAVSCNDLIQGPEGGKKIYDEDKEASPAIWKRNDEVTIKTNETDVIRRIVIKDQRPDKDGEAKIVKGGQGQKNVTVQLMSPTVLRGYDFHIEVYAVPENEQEIYEPEVTTELADNATTMQAPVMENDTNVNVKTENATESDKSLTEDREILTGQEKVPIFTDKAKTDIKDPIAQYVNEKTGEVLDKKSAPLKSYSLLRSDQYTSHEQRETTERDEVNQKEMSILPMHPHLFKEENQQKTTETHAFTTEKLDESDRKRYQDNQQKTTETHAFTTEKLDESDRKRYQDNQQKTTETHAFTTEKLDESDRKRYQDNQQKTTETHAFTTEKLDESDRKRYQDNQQKTTETHAFTTEKLDESDRKRYQDISKELGQHIVFGIKRTV